MKAISNRPLIVTETKAAASRITYMFKSRDTSSSIVYATNTLYPFSISVTYDFIMVYVLRNDFLQSVWY